MREELNKTQHFVANVISKFIIYFVNLIFRHEKKFNNAVKEFNSASDRLDKTWEEIYKKKKRNIFRL